MANPPARRRTVSDAVLESLRRPRSSADVAEDDEIGMEISAAIAENRDLGDATSRLHEWRQAERALDADEDSSTEHEALQQQADQACDAFHEAEALQRRRYGYSRRRRP